uniref:AB hydrolase-1 domain-containing protein n=1 Tax=Biomphalaria glabrata TaxID=6526 RepID=A0A2C9M3K5_BIOGL
MTNAIFLLLDHLEIDKLHGSVGSSLGGMLSLQSAVSYPERVGRLITISSCAQSHPSSIAMRYLQRKCIMSDPNWNNGHYYGKAYPKIGMKLARYMLCCVCVFFFLFVFIISILTRGTFSLVLQVSLNQECGAQGGRLITDSSPAKSLIPFRATSAMDMFDIAEGYNSLEEGLSRVKCPVMVIGVQTDVLFPIWQQRELASLLQRAVWLVYANPVEL